MAAAAAIPTSGRITTTHFFSLFYGHCHHRRCKFSLITHHRSSSTIPSIGGRFSPLLLTVVSPLSPFLNINNRASTASRRRMQLSCYGTGIEMQNDIESLDKDDSDIRKAGNALDIRVGKILKAWKHEEADSLYVEEVNVGEPEPRIICSGLVQYIPLHLLQDSNVIVLTNLKPRNMRGVKSFGMLMVASDATHENVELLVPPESAVPGERVWFGSAEEKENLPEVASPNQVQKKKIWETVQPHLKTDNSCVAVLGSGHQMRTKSGVVVCKSLKNANIS